MIIVWAGVIGISLLVEFLTYELVSIFFVPAALVALIMAPIDVVFWWQIVTFLVLAVFFVLAFRPVMKRTLMKEKDTNRTNITDANIGKQVRLLEDTVDGQSLIEVNGVPWSCTVDKDGLEKGSMVEIVGSESNKFIVKGV